MLGPDPDLEFEHNFLFDDQPESYLYSIPTTVNDEGDKKAIKDEDGTDADYSNGWHGYQTDMPVVTEPTAIPKRKRTTSDRCSTYAEDSSCLSSSMEDYQLISGGDQIFETHELSPRSQAEQSKKAKIKEIKFSPNHYDRTLPSSKTLEKDMESKMSDSPKGRRRNTSHQKIADDTMLKQLACQSAAVDFLKLNKPQASGQRISLAFRNTPPSKTRPSYPNCEGSRGAIKTDGGENVELTVNSHWLNTKDSMLITGLVSPSDDCTAKIQPHFKVYSVGEHSGDEFDINGVSVIGSLRQLAHGQSNLAVDVGIMRKKRDGTRAARLQRDCHIVFCLCVLEQQNGKWVVVDIAQICTEIINIDQPLGAPVVTNISLSKCVMEGGVYIGVKGRNLLGKSDDSSVTFYDPKTKWKSKAEICKEVTTKESMLFKVPRFPVEKYFENGNYPIEVKVLIRIKVDRREAEKGTDFVYYRMDSCNRTRNSKGRYPQMNVYRQPLQGEPMTSSETYSSGLQELGNVEEILHHAEVNGLEMPNYVDDTYLSSSSTNPMTSDWARDHLTTLGSGYLPREETHQVNILDQRVAGVHLLDNSLSSLATQWQQ